MKSEPAGSGVQGAAAVASLQLNGDEHRILNPCPSRVIEEKPLTSRRALKAGDTVGLVDISKPGGSVLLDRLELLLSAAIPGLRFQRAVKPTFSAPMPSSMHTQLASCAAVVLALAD